MASSFKLTILYKMMSPLSHVLLLVLLSDVAAPCLLVIRERRNSVNNVGRDALAYPEGIMGGVFKLH